MNSAPTSVPVTGASSASAPPPSVLPPTLPPAESTHDLLHVRRRPILSRWFERGFEWTCAASTWFGLGVLVVLLIGVLWQGAGWLTWSFLTNYDSRHPENAGVIAGLWGSFWLVSLATLLTVPIGVGAAIFLEEYQTKGWLRTLIEVNLSNLAGVPSIVYGILGMAVFVKMFGAFQRDPQLLELSLGFTSVEIPLPFGRTVLSGAMTLAALDAARCDCRVARGACERFRPRSGTPRTHWGRRTGRRFATWCCRWPSRASSPESSWPLPARPVKRPRC